MASHVLDLAPDFDDGMLESVLDANERAGLDELLDRRIDTRMPLAYLVGEAWFAGLRLRVDSSVLVPRSPLAELIVDGFAPWLDATRPLHALDMGTGSGCLAVALAWHWKETTVDAVDVSPKAVALARENARLLGVSERVRVLVSDGFGALAGRCYDLVMSNPPYVSSASMASLPPEYRHEPELALAAGDDGLDFLRGFLRQLPAHLAPGGIAVVEVGEARQAVEALLADLPLIWLEFAAGGEGVFLLDQPAAADAARAVEAA